MEFPWMSHGTSNKLTSIPRPWMLSLWNEAVDRTRRRLPGSVSGWAAPRPPCDDDWGSQREGQWVAGLLPARHVMMTEALRVRVSPLQSSLLSSWDAISPGSFPALIGHIVSTFFLSLSILDTVIPFVVFHNWLFPPEPAHNSLKATSPRCTNSPSN